MITAIIGHRGSGKSAFLRRAQQLLGEADVSFVDIDTEIEAAAGMSIPVLFPKIGEVEFRAIERATAAEWFGRLDGETAFVSVGAGFDGELPPDVAVLWIQRVTDSHGRVFLDRPPLEPGLSPLDEFAARFGDRQRRYAALADETYVVPEGCDGPSAADALVLGVAAEPIGGWLTVLGRDIAGRRWEDFVAKRVAWGVDRFEIRDDLVDRAHAGRVEAIPPSRRLISYRTGERWLDALHGPEVLTDWALELGEPPGRFDIVSLHEGGVLDGAPRLEELGGDAHLKLAIEIDGFEALRAGHDWWSLDPENRSFLPLSGDGRWSWYRRLRRGSMLVNFFREGEGSAADQPTLAEWVATPPGAPSFAAILGDPVRHSRTPWEQGGYFAGRAMGVLSVQLALDELPSLEMLASMGLTHAAVTAPLKEGMFELCDEVVEPAGELEAVNTIVRHRGRWIGTNTDLAGVVAATADIGPEDTVVLWGGGGTRTTVLAAVPHAIPYSARAGEPLAGFEAPDDGPDIVIWAVGRDRQPACQWPPHSWAPRQVIDLNYTEDSPGLEYAWRLGAGYRSGVEMFEAQAARQREFWDGR